MDITKSEEIWLKIIAKTNNMDIDEIKEMFISVNKNKQELLNKLNQSKFGKPEEFLVLGRIKIEEASGRMAVYMTNLTKLSEYKKEGNEEEYFKEKYGKRYYIHIKERDGKVNSEYINRFFEKPLRKITIPSNAYSEAKTDEGVIVDRLKIEMYNMFLNAKRDRYINVVSDFEDNLKPIMMKFRSNDFNILYLLNEYNNTHIRLTKDNNPTDRIIFRIPFLMIEKVDSDGITKIIGRVLYKYGETIEENEIPKRFVNVYFNGVGSFLTIFDYMGDNFSPDAVFNLQKDMDKMEEVVFLKNVICYGEIANNKERATLSLYDIYYYEIGTPEEAEKVIESGTEFLNREFQKVVSEIEMDMGNKEDNSENKKVDNNNKIKDDKDIKKIQENTNLEKNKNKEKKKEDNNKTIKKENKNQVVKEIKKGDVIKINKVSFDNKKKDKEKENISEEFDEDDIEVEIVKELNNNDEDNIEDKVFEIILNHKDEFSSIIEKEQKGMGKNKFMKMVEDNVHVIEYFIRNKMITEMGMGYAFKPEFFEFVKKIIEESD